MFAPDVHTYLLPFWHWRKGENAPLFFFFFLKKRLILIEKAIVHLY